MIKRKLTLLILLLLASSSSITFTNVATADTSSIIYVIPAVTDIKILPTSNIPASYISDKILLMACPGEYEPASFIIRAQNSINSLQVMATDLTNGTNIIPSSNVDIKTVGIWYQFEDKWLPTASAMLTPELLLNDASLIKTEGNLNYVKLNGQYVNISEAKGMLSYWDWFVKPENFPVQDAASLQPVDIPVGQNKQFWVTVKVPSSVAPGVYNGAIRLTTPSGSLNSISLRVEVLPITLASNPLMTTVYYTGHIDPVLYPNGSISNQYKTLAQIQAEYKNMYDHGINYPMVYQDWADETLFNTVLQIIKDTGFPTDKVFIVARCNPGNLSYGTPQDAATLDLLKKDVAHVISLCRAQGFGDIYFYGQDEADEPTVTAQRPAWQAIHEAGGKVFVAGYHDANFRAAGDLLDLLNCAWEPTIAESDLWHSVGHLVTNYANPQCGTEDPLVYRRNYGLLLWQRNYDGGMDWAYQGQYGTPWNEFDYNTSTDKQRDYMMTYPTVNGVIDTIQWEGWREAVDDIRYLTTLTQIIQQAKAQGKDTSVPETWLANLKKADLKTQNLNTVRSQMITYIMNLSDSGTNQPPVLTTIGNKSVNVGQLLSFVISATDPKGDALIYSASNLPSGANFNPSTRTFSWIPITNQSGIYSNVHFQVSDGSLITSENITITVTTATWDVNMDGSINVLDMIIISQHFGETGTPGWIKADVNRDGIINVLDNTIVGQHWTG